MNLVCIILYTKVKLDSLGRLFSGIKCMVLYLICINK